MDETPRNPGEEIRQAGHNYHIFFTKWPEFCRDHSRKWIAVFFKAPRRQVFLVTDTKKELDRCLSTLPQTERIAAYVHHHPLPPPGTPLYLTTPRGRIQVHPQQ